MRQQTVLQQAGRAPLRRGLVLGGGGVLGSAWMIGALRAYEEATGIDPRGVDIVIGTSAGSVLAALVSSGVATETMVAQQRGLPIEGVVSLDYSDINADLPPRPRFRMGSGKLLAASARNPRSVTPLVALTAFLPQGRGTMAGVGALVDSAQAAAGPGWPLAPRTWIISMDYATGARVVFGSPGAPDASLSQAVIASCAIPGWYEPATINGRRYVDGGTRSHTSLDLLAPIGLDEIIVLAPLASFAYDHPHHPAARIERRIRRSMTARLEREAALVRRGGTRVTMLGPGPADLEVIGANIMDTSRIKRVLETSLLTSREVFAGLPDGGARPDLLAEAG